MNTDGGYNSPDVDEALRENQVVQIQTAIRGRKPAQEKLPGHRPGLLKEL